MAAIFISPIEKQLNLQVLTHGKLTWVYIEKPTRQEMDYLGQNFPFHPLNLDDCLSKVQRPKIDKYDDHLFIVLHFPVYNKEMRVTTASEVDIFIGTNYIVSVHCSADLKPLSKLFKDCQLSEQIRQGFMGRSASYLCYQIVDALAQYCFPILNSVMDNIDKIEDGIFTNPIAQTVQELSYLRRDLISFRRIIHPQIAVIEALEKEQSPIFKEDPEDYFGDVADHIRHIWDGLEDSKEVVDSLSDTSNWLTSHHIQETMRILTMIMGFLAPLTFITGLYGMNIWLPGGHTEGEKLTFYILLVLMLGLLGGMFLYMRRKRWI